MENYEKNKKSKQKKQIERKRIRIRKKKVKKRMNENHFILSNKILWLIKLLVNYP